MAKIKLTTEQDHKDMEKSSEKVLKEFKETAEKNGWHCSLCKEHAMKANYVKYSEEQKPDNFEYESD